MRRNPWEISRDELAERAEVNDCAAAALYWLTEYKDLEGDMALARIERDEAVARVEELERERN